MTFIKIKDCHINLSQVISVHTNRVVMDEIEVTVKLVDRPDIVLRGAKAAAFIAYLDGISEQIHVKELEAVA